MTDGRDHWIGFDLGGTKMLAVVFDSNFEAVGRCRKKTKGQEGQKVGLQRIGQTIRGALDDAGISVDRLAGIGIGCPGPLDLKTGVIHEAPNLGWREVPVKKFLEQEFGCETVVSNDVDSGVFGEYSFGAARGANCVVGIFPGTGIGGGCVYQGQLIQGANCTCMEIGHIPIMSDGLHDGAGNVGTLESVASRLAISGAAAQAAYRGQAPALMAATGTDIAEIRSAAIARSIENGDETVQEIVEHAAQHISTAVVTVVLLLAPDVIVLGGGLVEAMPKLFVDKINKLAKRRILPAYRDVFKIVPAQLGDDAAVMGAAAWARTTLSKSQ